MLVHVTARPDWSNLPLSGLFVEMLERLAQLSSGSSPATPDRPLPPVASLTAFGALGDPTPAARALTLDPTDGATLGPRLPPGLYGDDRTPVAVNLSHGVSTISPIDLPGWMDTAPLSTPAETPLLPWLLAMAAILLAIDGLCTLWLKGVFRGHGGPPVPKPARPSTRVAGAVVAIVGLTILPMPATDAQSPEEPEAFALAMSTQTHLAYIETGDPEVDRVSAAGLDGLSRVLRLRTAAEPVGAVGVDLETDDIAFFPFLYWPMVEGQAPPSPAATDRLEAYLLSGGTVVFDTRDGPTGGGAGQAALMTVTQDLDLPPLVPVPPEHVLTRAFYLLQDFPGRYVGSHVWVEDTQSTVNDGVSSIIVGSNDWAAAWAMDAAGQPLFPMVPGGDRQREMAIRFGVNLTMYALTGNYKADQVHLPAIIERLGQ